MHSTRMRNANKIQKKESPWSHTRTRHVHKSVLCVHLGERTILQRITINELREWMIRSRSTFVETLNLYARKIDSINHTQRIVHKLLNNTRSQSHARSHDTRDNDDRECLLCRIHTTVQTMHKAETPDNNWMETRRAEIQETKLQQQRQRRNKKLSKSNRFAVVAARELESERHIPYTQKFRFTCMQHDMKHTQTHSAYSHTHRDVSTTN